MRISVTDAKGQLTELVLRHHFRLDERRLCQRMDQQLVHNKNDAETDLGHWITLVAHSPHAPVSLANREAPSTATPTIARKMLHTALISGFAPSRISE
jgi:hypothetical protein